MQKELSLHFMGEFFLLTQHQTRLYYCVKVLKGYHVIGQKNSALTRMFDILTINKARKRGEDHYVHRGI